MDLYKDLPFRLSIKRDFKFGDKRSYKWYWNSRHHMIGDYSIWTALNNLIERNIGKSFDLTFHYFCKHFPKRYQHKFLDCFGSNYNWWTNYYIDDNGLIQTYYPKNVYKGPYKVKSLDYKIQWKRIYPRSKSFTNSKIVDHLEWYDDEKNFVKIIQGEIYEFQSKRDPQYIAYKRKKYKQYLLDRKQYKKQMKELSIATFHKAIENCSAEARRQRGIDQVKLLKHGFDEDSFKGLNYHGRKNKNK